MTIEAAPTEKHPSPPTDALSDLRNVGPVTRKYFRLLEIETLEQLAVQNADDLCRRLGKMRGEPADPCVHDIFSATIHQARTGDALPWWHFSGVRKRRNKATTFPKSHQDGRRRQKCIPIW
jgi:hypothetical protein